MGQAIKLKVAKPDLHFQEDYSIKNFKVISGEDVVYDVVDSYQALLEKVMK